MMTTIRLDVHAPGFAASLAVLMVTQNQPAIKKQRQQVGEFGGPDGDAEPAESGRKAIGQLRMLFEVPTARINSIQTDGWEEVDLVVDSGASETVIAPDMLQTVELRTGNTSKRGLGYEVADGTRIKNQGEKSLSGLHMKESTDVLPHKCATSTRDC